MTAILWEWDVPDTGAPDSYNLYTGTVSGQETLRTSNITQLSFLDSQIELGMTYYGYTKAVYGNIITNSSNEASVLVPAPTPPPQPLVSTSCSGVDVEIPTFTPSDLYVDLQSASNVGGPWTDLQTDITIPTTFSYAYSATQKYYRLVSRSYDGTRTYGDYATAVPAPKAPDLVATLTAYNKATIQIPALTPNTLVYTLQRYTTVWADLATPDPSTNYVDTLIKNSSYQYRLVATGPGGSCTGQPVSIYSTDCTPSQPSFILAYPTSSTDIVVYVPVFPLNATSMSLQRSLDNDIWTTIVTELTPSQRIVDTGLTPNTPYYYRCVAISECGQTNGQITSTRTTLTDGAVENVGFTVINVISGEQTTITVLPKQIVTGYNTRDIEDLHRFLHVRPRE